MYVSTLECFTTQVMKLMCCRIWEGYGVSFGIINVHIHLSILWIKTRYSYIYIFFVRHGHISSYYMCLCCTWKMELPDCDAMKKRKAKANQLTYVSVLWDIFSLYWDCTPWKNIFYTVLILCDMLIKCVFHAPAGPWLLWCY